MDSRCSAGSPTSASRPGYVGAENGLQVKTIRDDETDGWRIRISAHHGADRAGALRGLADHRGQRMTYRVTAPLVLAVDKGGSTTATTARSSTGSADQKGTSWTPVSWRISGRPRAQLSPEADGEPHARARQNGRADRLAGGARGQARRQRLHCRRFAAVEQDELRALIDAVG